MLFPFNILSQHICVNICLDGDYSFNELSLSVKSKISDRTKTKAKMVADIVLVVHGQCNPMDTLCLLQSYPFYTFECIIITDKHNQTVW